MCVKLCRMENRVDCRPTRPPELSLSTHTDTTSAQTHMVTTPACRDTKHKYLAQRCSQPHTAHCTHCIILHTTHRDTKHEYFTHANAAFISHTHKHTLDLWEDFLGSEEDSCVQWKAWSAKMLRLENASFFLGGCLISDLPIM